MVGATLLAPSSAGAVSGAAAHAGSVTMAHDLGDAEPVPVGLSSGYWWSGTEGR